MYDILNEISIKKVRQEITLYLWIILQILLFFLMDYLSIFSTYILFHEKLLCTFLRGFFEEIYRIWVLTTYFLRSLITLLQRSYKKFPQRKNRNLFYISILTEFSCIYWKKNVYSTVIWISSICILLYIVKSNLI